MMPRQTIVTLCLLAVLPAAAQVATKANEEYRTKAKREKAAREMDHPIRPKVEQSARLMASLPLRPGDVVADIGTGVGYMLPYLVAAVGSSGRVIAEDIHPDFVARIREKIQENRWSNVTAVLGTPRDPRLPAGAADVALVLDVYHHLDYPAEMLAQIRRALKPGGRLIVVDCYRSRKHPGATDEDLREHVRLDRDEVIREVQAGGFRLVSHFDHLPHLYVLVFR